MGDWTNCTCGIRCYRQMNENFVIPNSSNQDNWKACICIHAHVETWSRYQMCCANEGSSSPQCDLAIAECLVIYHVELPGQSLLLVHMLLLLSSVSDEPYWKFLQWWCSQSRMMTKCNCELQRMSNWRKIHRLTSKSSGCPSVKACLFYVCLS